MSLTGFYLYNRTNEPCQNYFGSADQNEPNRFADPLDYILAAAAAVAGVEQHLGVERQLGDVAALRHDALPGQQHAEHRPSIRRRSGFKSNYLGLITRAEVPAGPLTQLRSSCAGRTLGAINPTQINWKSTSANAAYSRSSARTPSRWAATSARSAMDSYLPGDSSGCFYFDNEFTSANASNSNATSGNAFASFLLGYPSANTGNVSQFTISTPLNVFTYYTGGYAQDDWRVNSKFTLNYGIRLEHETGLAEQNNNFTVGFDRRRPARCRR